MHSEGERPVPVPSLNGGILNHAFDHSRESPDRRFSMDSVLPSLTASRTRPTVQRSLTMADASGFRRLHLARQPRTMSLNEAIPEEVIWRRRDSRRLSFCPRGSLLEVIKELGPQPTIPESGDGDVKDGTQVSVISMKPEPEDIPEKEAVETPLSILTQVFIPFLLAGLGMVAAGVLLNQVKVRSLLLEWRL